jgi:hypothetical protein
MLSAKHWICLFVSTSPTTGSWHRPCYLGLIYVKDYLQTRYSVAAFANISAEASVSRGAFPGSFCESECELT